MRGRTGGQANAPSLGTCFMETSWSISSTPCRECSPRRCLQHLAGVTACAATATPLAGALGSRGSPCRLPAPPWGRGQQGCSGDRGSAATARALGGLGSLRLTMRAQEWHRMSGKLLPAPQVGPLGPSLDSLGAEAGHGGGRLGGEADLLFTSHKISFSGGAAKRM